MKIRVLSLALVAVLPLAACSRPTTETTTAPETASSDAMPAPAPTAAPAETAADAMPMQNPMVGGAPMYADKDIVDNAVNSKDHTTLVAAVKAAGLVDTLKGAGPFTVFAPTNAAFDKLPKGTVDTLLKPNMKADLTKVLTYHVVPGALDAAALKQQIAAGNGTATLTTVQGEKLTAKDDGAGGIVLTDAKGGTSHVTVADVMQKNGVIHVVDTVLMP
ncbi:fasciclin domain-containing protein [Lysobacter sp. PAGU 2638]